MSTVHVSSKHRIENVTSEWQEPFMEGNLPLQGICISTRCI